MSRNIRFELERSADVLDDVTKELRYLLEKMPAPYEAKVRRLVERTESAIDVMDSVLCFLEFEELEDEALKREAAAFVASAKKTA
ncbi:hypothetical protein ACQR1W_01850 [Bradyrhizobium sp. HKCCYLS1011]|uniref:hypothetical protein n=1 Tax=Bradyrhizobium sp. HKCCYLS1011 TaxID=3420733 RepID=UPI003EBD15F5